MTEPREIEAKFEIADPTPLLELAQAPPLDVDGRTEIEQVDTYLDTADAALKSSGSTLRLRETNGVWTLTFKGARAAMAQGQRHVASRVEVNERVDVGVARTILSGRRSAGRLAPLVLAAEITRGGPLVQVARIQTQRTAIDLIDPEGRRFELAIDRCRGERLADGRVIEFSEVELEARDPDPAALVKAARALRAAVPGLQPSGQTKLARVLG